MTKYDLQTLLAVKPNAHIELDRFSDQAFTNNLVRSNVLSEQPVNRPRNVSGHSRRNAMVPLGLSTQNALRHPSHSAVPPDSQVDVAFVRFVEQHTSPKPQRVTAGGRIVPMNPWDSPPKWNLPLSSKGASATNSDASRTVGTIGRGEVKFKSEDRTRQQGVNSSESRVPKTAPLPADAANAPCFHPLSSISSAFPYASIPWPSQQIQGAAYPALGLGGDGVLSAFAQPPTPSQMMAAQISSFPFQPQPTPTAAPSFPSWNTTNTVAPGTFGPYQSGYTSSPSGTSPQWPQFPQLPPLPQAPQVSQALQLPQLPLLPQLPQLPPLPQAPPTVGNQTPEFNQQFAPSYFQDAIYQKSVEDAAKQYEALSAQLSQIDRFTAMHAWVIDPETKKLLVEQRKSLVRELDTVRIYKEHLQVLFGKFQMRSTPGPQKETIRVPVTPSRNDDWDTPTKSKSKSLSPTVRNLYRTIEETDERGEPIDALLRALSGASKGLAKRLSEERKKSLGVPAKEHLRELSNAFMKTKEEPLQEGPGKAEYAQPVQMSRRLWQSDPYPHSPLLSQCFSKDWSPVLQKSAAPAVSQNVTAHAFLPSFDGVGRTADGFELI
ncbi:hypothetical protein BDW59DRAFT_169942 [Aspergillus cavernicola]|uniref:Uncharacterized protein n=1 Tax=Aspergillus cavernicola TaxID=176166 RepID=A0ABR4IV41_9EURO